MNYFHHRFRLLFAFVACSLIFSSAAQAKKLNVITATTDLAALAQEVGCDTIDLESVSKGCQDYHLVESKSCFLHKLRHAYLRIIVGLDLVIGSPSPMITQIRNPKIQPSS